MSGVRNRGLRRLNDDNFLNSFPLFPLSILSPITLEDEDVIAYVGLQSCRPVISAPNICKFYWRSWRWPRLGCPEEDSMEFQWEFGGVRTESNWITHKLESRIMSDSATRSRYDNKVGSKISLKRKLWGYTVKDFWKGKLDNLFPNFSDKSSCHDKLSIVGI